MRAMILDAPGSALREDAVADPVPGEGQVLVKVAACALCRTDLHIVDGELTRPKLPLVPGHMIVGEVVTAGIAVETVRVGDRVGIPWLGWTDGTCVYCTTGRENLCEHARFTGYDVDGGYAEYTVADARFCFPVDRSYSDVQAAPLLCANKSRATGATRLADNRTPRIGPINLPRVAFPALVLINHLPKCYHSVPWLGSRLILGRPLYPQNAIACG